MSVVISHPAGDNGRSHVAYVLGTVVIGFITVAGLYSYRASHEPEAALAAYLRGTISCCTARQLEPFAANPESPAILIQILSNPVDEPYWDNAVLALGVVAPYSDDLATRLLEFVDTPGVFAAVGKPVRQSNAAKGRIVADAEISEGLFAAKMHALVACGNLIGRAGGETKDSASLDTLIAGTDPAFWQGRIQWRSIPHFASDEERNAALAGEAVKALAASHLPQAEKRLLYLRDTVRPTQPLLRESLEQALCDKGSASCAAAQ